MNTLKNISPDDIRALINAISTLAAIQNLSDIEVARIEERILCYFQYYDNNDLFKNKNVLMFLSLPYEIQQSVIKVIDNMKIKADNKVIKFAQNLSRTK